MGISAQKSKEEEAKTKKGKKKGGKAKEEDDDLDALLLEFKGEEGNKEETAPAVGKGKKAKKGGKQANQDEDDAVFDEFKVTEKDGVATKSNDVAEDNTAAIEKEDGEENLDGAEDDANLDAKTLAN